MDRIIKLIQAAGAIALVVAINYEHVACATSHCDTTMQWCCLDGISNQA